MSWETIGRDTGLMIGAYIALFGWAVIHTVYKDHIGLVGFAQTARQQLKDSQKSGLQLQINEYGFSERMTRGDETPALAIPGSFAVMIASVRNLGPASIADGWELSVTKPDGSAPIKGKLIDFAFTNWEKNPIFHIEGDAIPFNKLLYRQTLTPIVTGDKKLGFVVFFMPGVESKELKQKGTTMTLSFYDIYMHHISETVTLKGANEGHGHFIGLE